jgi:hypothetical protein
MSEEETFAAGELLSAAPVLASGPFTQGHNFAPVGFDAGVPIIPSAAFTENNVFTANPILAGIPIVPILIYDAALGRIIDVDQDSASRADLTVSGPNKVEIAA